MTILRIPAWLRMCGVFAVLVACVGCSSSGRFITGDTQKDFMAIKDYTPKWEDTGEQAVDTVGRSVVISQEDKKPELVELMSKLYSQKELNFLIRSTDAALKDQGIEDPTPQQKREVMRLVYAKMTPEEQQMIDQYAETEGPAIAAREDDLAEIGAIALRLTKVALDYINHYSNASGADVAMAIFTKVPAIRQGYDMGEEVIEWGNAASEFLADYGDALDTWDEVVNFNREQALD
jgi:hypothetical protein